MLINRKGLPAKYYNNRKIIVMHELYHFEKSHSYSTAINILRCRLVHCRLFFFIASLWWFRDRLKTEQVIFTQSPPNWPIGNINSSSLNIIIKQATLFLRFSKQMFLILRSVRWNGDASPATISLTAFFQWLFLIYLYSINHGLRNTCNR